MIESISSSSAFLEGAPQSLFPDSRRPGGNVSPQQDRQQSEKDQAQIAALKQRDREVRAHEQAHVAAGGIYVRGGANFGYTTGPDGKQYATSGEVSIDTSPGRTPEETIDKARTIRRAALAPADPSPQDHAVAAQAASMEMQAVMEQATQQKSPGQYSSVEGGTLRLEALLPRVGLNIDTTA